MHIRTGWGRRFQIRGARFEKQTEPDVVRGRNGVKEDWFPLVSWECFVRFSSSQAMPKWHFCPIRASWRAQRCSMLDNRSSTSRGPTAHCQVTPTSSTDLASGSSVQLTWLAQALRRHLLSIASNYECGVPGPYKKCGLSHVPALSACMCIMHMRVYYQQFFLSNFTAFEMLPLNFTLYPVSR